MLNAVINFVWILLALYLAVCAYMYFTQRQQLYHPTAGMSDVAAEALVLDVDDVRIKVWQIRRASDDAILFFGGNAEDAGASAALFAQTFPNHSLFLMNYRGYGGSDGQPTETALFTDALALLDHVSAEHSRISVIGRSLGSGVAVHLAEQRDLHKLILVTPYDSIAAIAARRFPWLPVNLLLKDQFDSASRAPDIDEPVLIVKAETDATIPHAHTDVLVDAFRQSTPQSVTISGANHNTLIEFEQYHTALAKFLHAEP